ncbi:MAG: CsbD family protein, partial [Blastocatellia bacterium]
VRRDAPDPRFVYRAGRPDMRSSRVLKKKDNSIEEELGGLGERLKGAVKQGVGAVTGNESLRREGKRENKEGKARQEDNDVLD